MIRKPLEETILKNSQPDSSLYGDHMQLFIQPSGKFILSDALDAKYITSASRLMPQMDQSRGVLAIRHYRHNPSVQHDRISSSTKHVLNQRT